jgi:hypothetical protein
VLRWIGTNVQVEAKPRGIFRVVPNESQARPKWKLLYRQKEKARAFNLFTVACKERPGQARLRLGSLPSRIKARWKAEMPDRIHSPIPTYGIAFDVTGRRDQPRARDAEALRAGT